jgi:hypothetical protein
LTKVDEALREGSESAVPIGSVGEYHIIMPRPRSAFRIEPRPVDQGERIFYLDAQREFNEPGGVVTAYVFGPANRYHLVMGRGTSISIGVTTQKGDGNQILGTLQGANPRAADRIRKLTNLEPDWDGYGGDPPTAEAIKMTAMLLLAIHRLAHGLLDSPFIAPSPDGGLGLEWEMDSGAELALIIPPTGTDIRYLLDEPTSSGNIIQSEGMLQRDATLSELLVRLTR